MKFMTGFGWADNLPAAQGLYDPSLEKDSCGVGFIVNIKGEASHDVLRDASTILCNMTHRGATGADARDGDGAGVMTSIPHDLFSTYALEKHQIKLPSFGSYAVGNLFLSPEEDGCENSKRIFAAIAAQHGLRILCWRPVERDNSMIGPSAKAKEPIIEQPLIVPILKAGEVLDQRRFEQQLYMVRKEAAHTVSIRPWFYACSLSNKVIVYKGRLAPAQLYHYFKDLTDERFKTHFALVHSRFSTNTFPSWDRAQPMRFCAHNGEINTLRGNTNWMRSREGVMTSSIFGSFTEKMYPIIEENGSDSAAFDNVLELLVINGILSLPEAVMVMIPEAWQNHPAMTPEKKAFYEWAACVMEPWDGPALITFADGRYVGACLDRNGLRPCRYYITNDNRMICASEVGTLAIDPATIVSKGRLRPGKMLVVDTYRGYVVEDKEIKTTACRRQPFDRWIKDNMLRMEDLRAHAKKNPSLKEHRLDFYPVTEDPRFKAFGLNLEQLNTILLPMVKSGKESLGSMGTDTPLACLSPSPRVIYDYFCQLFAQVTNPPIDPIRESIVMSLGCYVGPEGNLLSMHPSQCHRLHLPSPILTLDDLDCIKCINSVKPSWKVGTVDITFPKSESIPGYIRALDRVCDEVATMIDHGYKIAILSDRAIASDRIPLSTLVALGGVHHFLVRNKQRSRIALMVETAEAREVHHMSVLLGYGADAICPYLVQEGIMKLKRDNAIETELTVEFLTNNYKKALNNGILKVMSKMGISTLQSYKGAQIFETLGIDKAVINRCFVGTQSRIKGVGFEILAAEMIAMHDQGYPSTNSIHIPGLPDNGEYHWRSGGEEHINNPPSMAALQDAVRQNSKSSYEAYSKHVQDQIRSCTLRGLLEFRKDNVKPIPLDEVEPWTEIVKRFCTGAMSYGSISAEAHITLAKAMNRLGGKSNTGEGGEDPARSKQQENGDRLRSAIKQVASGRFGVTSYYLSEADEIQIKMAQGAKPGEGGELPGYKVSGSIATTRKSTPGVGLISPPPHHDIYSIEDLKQLIYDLKTSNPIARVSVKLVSEVGVGVIAAGVAKAKADHILISGHDGGTGAARWTSIKHAGLPWELGLAETHQTLVLNDLRGRVVLQTDGQIKTGRDVAISCLLGAEEWGFATTPLIAMGCIMMRKCHLNTCPVGIATQDPELRKKFEGQPEHVINFFHFVAEDLRQIMASLGLRTVNEMVGRADLLKMADVIRHSKAHHLDLRPILTPAHSLRQSVATYNTSKQNHQLDIRLDNKLIKNSDRALTNREKVHFETEIINTDRSVGSTLSFHVSRLYGEEGLPDDTIHVKFKGSAGQSFGAFLAPGVTLELEGDANDYVGKGLSGGHLVVFPSKASTFRSDDNVIVGNVCLYGATSGEAYFRGIAAERFAVRNSGAIAVCEGVGDHGCEYMTGGYVVILGLTGRNFAAGMSGGIAYILDKAHDFSFRCNPEMVILENVVDQEEITFLKTLIEKHVRYTGSEIGIQVLQNWEAMLQLFVKVYPIELKAVHEKQKALSPAQSTEEHDTAFESAVKTEEESLATKFVEDNATVAKAEKIVDIEDAALDETRLRERSLKMDKSRGFMTYKRKTDPYRDPKIRAHDYKEISHRMKPSELQLQAARCMDCGVPYCQSDFGCPIGNIIPKWNELIFQQQWKEAYYRLMMTNNFPEFTGRVCPAPCEGACVLGINEPPVAIKSIECAIIDKAFAMGWLSPTPPKIRTGKKIAIIGSGPAGLAAADQLNKIGHWVTVYDRNDRMGGLLMYGIPNMKLDKKVVQRRLDLMAAEGVNFVPGAHVGVTMDAQQLRADHHAVLVATGATWPRDLNIPNRNLDGIEFAMTFLQSNTKSLLDSQLSDGHYLSAKGKHVIVIGGGDTGCDCIATAVRHGAKSVVNFELLPRPPAHRAKDNPWPQYPRVFRVDYGHAEVQVLYGKDPRQYAVLSKEFLSDGQGHVSGIRTIRVEWSKDEQGRWSMREVPGSEEVFKADLVLLAMGFLGPEKALIEELRLPTDTRSNIQTTTGRYTTPLNGVFAAGDCRRGQSLVVWAIREGREAARSIDMFVQNMASTRLPITGGLPVVDLDSGAVRENLVKLY